jgi:cytochrome c553
MTANLQRLTEDEFREIAAFFSQLVFKHRGV